MKFILHIHPPRLSKNSIKPTHTFGLGGITALLFIILLVTGIMLRFKYVPSIEEAYNSILDIENTFVFGRLLRNLHYWSANLMILVCFLHLVRVLFSNSIYYNRASNWRYGIVLMLFILVFAFTGYLLSWDQLSYWAVTIMLSLVEYIPFVGGSIATWIKGGTEIGQQTLLTFYTLHTGLLPMLFAVLMMVHFYLVRKSGGVTYSLSENEVDEKVSSYPNLVRIEAVAALATFVVLLLLSIFFNAPLKDMANPEITPNPSKAPWYFIGLQEMLLHFHPLIVIVAPILVIWFLLKMPDYNCSEKKVGMWFNGSENIHAIIVVAILSLVWTVIIAFGDDILRASTQLNTQGIYGIILFVIYLIPIIYVLIKHKRKERASLSLIVFTFVAISYITLSLVAYFLRGEGMTLIFM